MKSNKEEQQNLIEDINLIEQNLEILSLPSALDIYASLMVKGKMNYEQIKKELPYGKSTIFRNLDKLIDYNLIVREEDKLIDDKRKNTYYYILKPGLKFPLINEKLLNFLKLNDKLHLLNQIDANKNNLSNTINKVLTNFKKVKYNQKVVSLFLLGEKEDFAEVEEKITELMVLISDLHKKRERDFKLPLGNPSMVSINFS